MFPGQLRPRFARNDREKRLVMMAATLVVGLTGVLAPKTSLTLPLIFGALALLVAGFQVTLVRRIARLRAVAGELALRHPGGTFLIGNVHDGPRPAVTGERDYHSRIVQLEPRVITIWNAEAPENPVAAIPLGDATITISDRASGAAARLQILVPDAPAPIALSLFRDTGLGARDADELRALVPAAASA